MPRHLPRWYRSKIWAFVSWGRAAGSLSVARPRLVDVFPYESIGWSRVEGTSDRNPTGLGQIYELVTQLRGEAGKRQVEKARFAIAENGGGFSTVSRKLRRASTILSRH